MKMWIIPVFVWVGLATTTVFAPKPDNNGFPFDPDAMGKKCNAATWVTSSVTSDMCTMLKAQGKAVKQAYEGMSPLDIQEVSNDAKKITSSPAWNSIIQARRACPQPKNGLGTTGCALTQKDFNAVVQHGLNVKKQTFETFEDCIAKQNRVEHPEATKQVLPFCLARTIRLTQNLKDQFIEDTKNK